MKNTYITLISLVTFGCYLVSCETETFGPVLGDSSTFISAELSNPASSAAVVLEADNAGNVYEEFSWSPSNFGVSLAVDYILEMDINDDFSTAAIIANTKGTSASFTVEDFNDEVLGLGVPGFAQDTVYIRVRTTVVGADVETLYSQSISRIVTTYRLSDCGNFCTIAIIGDATPGGWDTDTDMRLADASGTDRNTWTTTLFLSAASAKFRASDDWANNWGSTAFPAGTGTQNGDNIPVDAPGYYKVTFNDATGDYTFELLAAPTFTTVGIIGDATPGGWDSDTDLAQDATDVHIWAGPVTLVDGEAKFRADDDWAVNWGEVGYPSGFGAINGPNIPVLAGSYTARIHDVTGEYYIMTDATAYGTIGIIGDATPGGWDSDTDLIQNPSNPYLWSGIITLTDGEVKFRADDAWDNNWGGSAFPAGVGIKNGPNTPVNAGTYFVTFNSGTGEYRLLK